MITGFDSSSNLITPINEYIKKKYSKITQRAMDGAMLAVTLRNRIRIMVMT